MAQLSAKEVKKLALPENLKKSGWDEQVKSALGGKQEKVVIEKVLGDEGVIRHKKWPALMKYLIAIQPTFEEMAEKVYNGRRVSKNDDEGFLCQGWDDGGYTNINSIIEVMANPVAFEQDQWHDLLVHLLKRCRETSLEAGFAIIREIFEKPFVHKSSKWKNIEKTFDKYVTRDDGLEFEWCDFKKSLEKPNKVQKKVRSLKELYGWSPSYLKDHKHTSLDFQSERLVNGVPPEVYNHLPLQRLTFRDVKLSEIGPEIGKLKNLQELTVLDCPLQALPEEIGSLKKLSKLWISETNITTLPKSITGLTSLQELIVGSNKIAALAEDIGRLKRLKVLHIQENPVNALPESFYSLRNLEALFIYKTRIPKNVLSGLKRRFPKCQIYLKP